MTELNLIPYELKEKKSKKSKLVYLVGITIIIAIVTSMAIYFPQRYYKVLSHKEGLLKVEAAKYYKLKDENKELNERIKALETGIDLVEKNKDKRTNTAELITSIEEFLPHQLVITEVRYNNKDMNLNGSTDHYNLVAEFVANLQETDKFKSARILSINKTEASESNHYKFSINIKY